MSDDEIVILCEYLKNVSMKLKKPSRSGPRSKYLELLKGFEAGIIKVRSNLTQLPYEYKDKDDSLLTVKAEVTEEGYLRMETQLRFFHWKVRRDSIAYYSFITAIDRLKKSQKLPYFTKAAIIFEMNNMVQDADNTAVFPIVDALKTKIYPEDCISHLDQVFIPGKSEDGKLIVHVIPKEKLPQYLMKLGGDLYE